MRGFVEVVEHLYPRYFTGILDVYDRKGIIVDNYACVLHMCDVIVITSGDDTMLNEVIDF